MKKLLLIALAVTGFAFASAPSADAGIRVGIGIGVPVGYGYGGYGGYGYAAPYGYYNQPYGHPYYSSVHYRHRPRYVRSRAHYHWYRGERVYCTRLHRRY